MTPSMSVLQWTSLAQTITGTPNTAVRYTINDDETPPTTQSNNMSRIGVRFVSDEVKRDHRDLEILYKGLIQAVNEGDDDAAAALQSQLSWELARHLVAMQLFVFPGTEQRADEGNGKAMRRRSDLAAIREHVLHLVDLTPSDAGFRAACERLNDTLKQHIRDVERTDLVAIEKALDGEESERMARDWESVGGFVPGSWSGEETKAVPFATVRELLGASYGDVTRAWKELTGRRVDTE